MKLRAAACVLVFLLARACPLAAQNPYNVELERIQQQLEPAELFAPEAALLLARAAELRELVDAPDALAAWFEAVARDRRQHPLVRDHARRYAALESLHRGDLRAAEARWAELGYLRQWQLLGPFPGLHDLDAELGPETGSGAAAESRDASGRVVQWRPAPAGAEAGLDLGQALAGGGPGVVFLSTEVEADAEREVALRIGSDSAVAVWVNGEPVLTAREERRAAFDQYTARARLRRGANAVRVKLRRSGEGPWRFEMRVTDARDDLAQLAAERGSGAEALELRARVEELQSAGDPVGHMQAAVAQAPTAARWLFLARQYRGTVREGTALDQALKCDPRNHEALMAAAGYYASRQQHDKALELLRAAAEISPGDFVALQRMAELYASAGQDERAAAELLEIGRRFPAPLWVKRQLAQQHERAGQVQQALALTRQILARNAEGGEDRARWERLIERADGREAAAGGARPALSATATDADAPYLVEVAAELKRVWAKPPAQPALVLADVRVQRVRENGLDEVRAQQLIYVGTEEAAREHATRAVQYSPGSEALRILRAQVHKRDGRVIAAVDAGETHVSEPEIAMYYDVRARSLRFRELQKGDVLELDYRIEPTVRANPYGEYFGEVVLFAGALPQRLQRYVLITPGARAIAAHQQRMPAAQVTAGAEVVRVWEMRDLPALALEPRGPSASEVAPYVHVSTFASWDELGRWYAQLIAPQFGLDAGLRELAGELTRGARSEAEKVHAIHQYVLRNTHYVALEFGIHTYKPYAVAEVHARRYGDCKDKAALMIALLREVGVEAQMALVRTRRLGEIAERPASMAVFNHAVVYLPRHGLWLDGTAEYAGSRELPLDDQGALAVTIAADGSTTMRRLPRSGARDNLTRRQVRAQVREDGSVQFAATNQTRGEDAPGLRREFEYRERQVDVVRGRMSEVFPAVQVEDVTVEGADDVEHDVRVEVRGTLENFLGQPRLRLPATWEPRRYTEKLAPLATRTQALQLPAPWTTEEEIEFALPPRARLVNVPRDIRVESAFGTARVQFTLQAGAVVVSSAVEFTRTRIEAEGYAAFRDFCRRVEDAFRSEIEVALR